MKKYFLFIGIFFLVLNLYGCFKEDKPSEVINAFYLHISKGEVQSATDLLSSNAIEMLQKFGVSPASAISDTTKKYNKKGGIKDVQIIKEEILGETAQVSSKINFVDGTFDNENDKLIKQNGKWKIEVSK